jgi:tetratricopeptide (TPR) repeat protein
MTKPVEVFFSYSHKDKSLRDKLANHLKIFERDGVINGWHDRKITAGSEWAGKIDERLSSAQIILLLVSDNFLASDYCYDIEMRRAIERHDGGEARVIPIILRPCLWESSPFGKLQPLPTDARPVTSWPNRDEAFLDIAKGIKTAVEEMRTAGEVKKQTPRFPTIWKVPHSRNPNFTGREEILSDLRTAVESGKPAALTQAISGLGGVGKTQLAIEYAYRNSASYTIVWWLHSEQPASLRAEYAGLAALLNLPEKDAQDQQVTVEAVKEWLRRNSNWLLIFDNAPDAESVRDYIPSGTGHIIVTSRDSRWRGVASSLTVRVLPASEAVDFISNRTGQQDEATAATLAEALGYLPLALEQAAAYIEACGCSLSHYENLFQQRKAELLRHGDIATGYPDSVATTWEVSFQQVESENAAAADLLKLCAFFAPDDIPLQVIKDGAKYLPEPLTSIATDTLAFDKSLAALRHYSLVEVKAKFISVHRLVQAVTQHRMSEEKVKKWTEAAARILNNAFPNDSLDFRTWKTCSLLLPHALAALSDADTLELDAGAISNLLNNVGLYLLGRADFEQAVLLLKRTLAIDESMFGPDHPNVATTLNNLGNVLQRLGDLQGAKAYYERALAIDEATLGPDHKKVAIRLNNLGSVLKELGDFDGAKAHLERALVIGEVTFGDSHPQVAVFANNLGEVLRELGDFDGAKAHLERALAIDEVTLGHNHPNVAIRLSNLGSVLRDLGDFDGAKAHLERALAISEAALGPDHPDVAIRLNNLGSVLKALGDFDGARRHLVRALQIFLESLGEEHPSTVVVRNNLKSLENR